MHFLRALAFAALTVAVACGEQQLPIELLAGEEQLPAMRTPRDAPATLFWQHTAHGQIALRRLYPGDSAMFAAMVAAQAEGSFRAFGSQKRVDLDRSRH